MGLLSFLFPKPRKMHDDFFGEMVFVQFRKEPEKNYFECRRNFQPTKKIIDIGLGGNIGEPLSDQRKFFTEIESKYESLIDTIIPVIEDEFRNWKEDFEIKDFQAEFSPEYLSIPQLNSEPFEWEIAFESIHDLNHQFTVTIKDWIAQSVLIDG